MKYEEILKGQAGKILTTTDARGVEIDQIGESREDPVAGENLKISLDVDLQQYAQQAALKVMEEKQAARVSILLMNPQNGENLCLCQCAGVRPQRSVHAAAGYNGTFGKRKFRIC